ncbi:hypothetical protein GCM10010269_19710 [Streptomyces humidus]|uniref:Uncharacterized protein n=1 Tax=Streptomyces humidus TaxID=52259 RepID=A0A918FTD2_9ACTN|nr:DUF6354 family protein [Streptomyces humidus]GGR80621.1 hypothetical protein GCM10010269_19710 [Streptomyces humidus]
MSITAPVLSAVGPVRAGQLWQDMAPDMVDRERMLRVVAVGATHADCVVERDNRPGAAGRKARPLALRRFATSAFTLIEDVVDDADQLVYARFLAAMTDVQGGSPSPVEYATAALRVHKELTAEAAKGQG